MELGINDYNTMSTLTHTCLFVKIKSTLHTEDKQEILKYIEINKCTQDLPV